MLALRFAKKFVSLQKIESNMVTTKEEKEKQRSARENLSKFFYDLAKTTFASTVVGDVVAMFLKEEVTTPAIALFLVGIATTILLALFGYRISKR